MKILTPEPSLFTINQEPYYLPVHQEIDIFSAAWRQKVPIVLKGPTGCGKTRFISYMAHKLSVPLITVSCHEDLSASDLIGRYLLQGDETIWSDGPMTAAVRLGAILYLDEVVEARKDTIVAIHPLTDHRRTLSIDKLASVLKAPASFMLVLSYNPGYQSILKEMKASTRQRFVSLQFSYPNPEQESKIIVSETEISKEIADKLVQIALRVRNLTDRGLDEGLSTRLLVHAARLIKAEIEPTIACNAAFAQTLSDDVDMQMTIQQLTVDFS
jgi:nitric oxide reductase NorQ protein